MPTVRRLLTLCAVLLSIAALGCAGVQRRQDRAVDAGLRDKAPRWKRAGRKPVRFGPYELVRVEAHRQFYDGEGGPGITINGAGREVSQYRSAVTVRHAETGRERMGRCKSRFVREGLEQLDGILASQSTRISVKCTIDGADGRSWRLSSRSPVGRDLSGRFVLDGTVGEGLAVELDLYNDLDGRRSRPVAHLRNAEGAVAGALLTFPERVWIDPQLDPDAAEASLVLLLSLRYLEYKPGKSSSDRNDDEDGDDNKGLLEGLLSGLR